MARASGMVVAVTAVVAAVLGLLAVASGAAGHDGAGPRLPAVADAFAPSLVRGRASGRELIDVGTCGACHPRQVEQWQSSAHAFASFDNPIYRASIEALRADVGRPASRHCGGCHDPALLVDGALDGAVAPTDERGHAGVTCAVCHGAIAIRADGNGSYELRAGRLPLPLPGDAPSLRAHRRAARPAADLCVACHRSFLVEATGNTTFLAGMDDVGAWQRSRRGAGLGQWLATEPVERQTCRDCHMPDGSHRFAGGHTWMAALRGDPDQARAIEQQLLGAVTVDIAAATANTGAALLAPTRFDPGVADEWVFDVVLVNRRVGHRFPGGIADVGASWLDVAVLDASGRPLARSGAEPDADAHVLRAQLVDDEGGPVDDRRVHRARAKAWDATIASGDARVVRFRWRPAPGSARPAAVRVRLRHQSRLGAVVDEACREARSARGRAFARAAPRPATGASPASPCATPPRLVIAESTLPTGAGPEQDARAWRRLYDLGRARLGDTQERVEFAREPLRRALLAAPNNRARAAVLVAMGRLEVRQGRTGQALWRLGWARLALALTPARESGSRADRAVVDRWIGRALSSVWRWRAAVAPLERAFAAVPGDPDAAVDLATALVAAGRQGRARDVIADGLDLDPRNSSLLRLQRLVWQGESRAWRAYVDNLHRDDTHELAAACGRRSTACARERRPIHEHVLRERR